MSTCSGCGRIMPEDSKFCPNCGEAVEFRTCSKCGKSNPSEYVYCNQCGNQLQFGIWQSGSEKLFLGPDDLSKRAKFLFYLVSFLVPIIGFVLGAIFYVRYPDPRGRFREAGKMCLILAIISILLALIVSLILLSISVITFNPPSI